MLLTSGLVNGKEISINPETSRKPIIQLADAASSKSIPEIKVTPTSAVVFF